MLPALRSVGMTEEFMAPSRRDEFAPILRLVRLADFGVTLLSTVKDSESDRSAPVRIAGAIPLHPLETELEDTKLRRPSPKVEAN
jgi:hypothetical protein